MSPTPIPSTSEELEELLNDGPALAGLVKENRLGELIQAYAKVTMSKHGGDLGAQIREQMQVELANWLKETREKDGATPVDLSPGEILAGRRSATAGYNPKALGSVLDAEPWAKDPASIFRAIWRGTEETSGIKDMRTKMRNAFSSEVPSEGGFLIPETLRSEMLRVALETSIVRPRARIIPMETLRVPYPAIDDTSHASSVYGGIVGYWTEEAAALTASQPSFGRIILEAKKLTAYTEVPNELISDSAQAFSQFFNEIFPEALAFYEDDGFINGTGVGEPQGYINAPGAIAVSRNTASHVKAQDIFKMYPRMLPASLNRAIWVASIDVLAELLQLVMPTGDATTTFVAPPLWLSMQSIAGAPTFTILGRPVVFSEKPPALGTKGDLAFVDFGYYLLGDRQAMSAQQSDQYKFANDMTAFRIIERLDGRCWLNSAITPKNSGNTLSPVVLLN